MSEDLDSRSATIMTCVVIVSFVFFLSFIFWTSSQERREQMRVDAVECLEKQ